MPTRRCSAVQRLNRWRSCIRQAIRDVTVIAICKSEHKKQSSKLLYLEQLLSLLV